MKKVLLVLAVFVLVFSVTSAYANHTSTGVWSFNLTPKHVRVQGDRSQVAFEIVESSAYINPAGCGITDAYEVIGDDNSSQMLSILLAAHMAGKKVNVLVHDTGCSYYNRARVTQIEIAE